MALKPNYNRQDCRHFIPALTRPINQSEDNAQQRWKGIGLKSPISFVNKNRSFWNADDLAYQLQTLRNILCLEYSLNIPMISV